MSDTIIVLAQPQDFPGHELGRQALKERMVDEYYSHNPIVALVHHNPNTDQYDVKELAVVAPYEDDEGWWWQYDSHSDGPDGHAHSRYSAASAAFYAMTDKYPDADYDSTQISKIFQAL